MTTARTEIMIKAKNLIFSGVHQNGLGLVGRAEALENERGDSFLNVTQVAGSGFGAIIALMLALNFTAAEMKKLYLDLNFKKDAEGRDLRKFIQALLTKRDCPINVTFAELAAKDFKKLYLATNIKVKKGDIEKDEPFYFSPQTTANTPILPIVIASVAVFEFYPPVYLKQIEPGKFVEVEKGHGDKHTAGVTLEHKDAYKIFGAEWPKGGTVSIYNTDGGTFEYNPSSAEKKLALKKGNDDFHKFFSTQGNSTSGDNEETANDSQLLTSKHSDEEEKYRCVIS